MESTAGQDGAPAGSARSLLSRLLAIVGPIITVAALVAPWAAPEADGSLAPAAQAMQDQLAAAGNPDVVILGASLATHDVDAEIMAEALGGEHTVLNLAVNGAVTPTWYAVFKNRVVDEGYRPKVVLVFDLVDRFFRTESPTARSQGNLRAQMRPDDVVILRKTLGQSVHYEWLNRMKRRRDQWRESLTDGIRDQSVRLLFGAGPAGTSRAAPALDVVFHESKLNRDRSARVIPVVEAVAKAQASEVPMEDSYVPDFAELARISGAKLVFVNAPLPESDLVHGNISLDFEARALRMFNELGAGWIDLRELPVSETDFLDGRHMNERGARNVSEHLADVLIDWDVLNGADLPSARLPLVPARIVRLGAGPVLSAGPPAAVDGTPCAFAFARDPSLDPLGDAALLRARIGGISPIVVFHDGEAMPAHGVVKSIREGCSGTSSYTADGQMMFAPPSSRRQVTEASHSLGWSREIPLRGRNGALGWWVYPGTTVEMEFDQPWTGGDFSASMIAQVVGDGQDGAVGVTVDGKAMELRGVGDLRIAQGTGVAPSGPWTVRVSNPEGNPFLVIRSLSFGSGEGTSYVVGSPGEDGTTSIRFIGRGQAGQSRLYDMHFDAPPPALQQSEAIIEGGTGSIQVLSDWVPGPRDQHRSNITSCPLIQVLHKGKPIEGKGGGCGKRDRLAAHTQCRDGAFVRFDVPPNARAEDYSLGLLEHRRCRQGAMLYPGDRMSFTLKSPVFSVGADALELVAATVTGAAGEVRVRLVSQGLVFVDEVLPMARLANGGKTWRLPARLESGSPVVLMVETGAHEPWMFIEGALLHTERPFEDLPVAADVLPSFPQVRREPSLVFVDASSAPRLEATGPVPELAVRRRFDRDAVTALRVPQLQWYLGPDSQGEACQPAVVTVDGIAAPIRRAADATVVIDPIPPQKTPKVSLDGQRTCGRSVLVYPKDTVRLKLLAPPDVVLQGDYDVALSGAGDLRRQADVRVLGRGVTLGELGLQGELGQAPKMELVRIPSELPGRTISAVVTNPGPTPLLIHRLELVPRAP